MVVPEIVPEITSLPIFTKHVPLFGKPVSVASVNEVAPAASAEFNVVCTPELTPLIVTLLDVLYM